MLRAGCAAGCPGVWAAWGPEVSAVVTTVSFRTSASEPKACGGGTEGLRRQRGVFLVRSRRLAPPPASLSLLLPRCGVHRLCRGPLACQGLGAHGEALSWGHGQAGSGPGAARTAPPPAPAQDAGQLACHVREGFL